MEVEHMSQDELLRSLITQLPDLIDTVRVLSKEVTTLNAESPYIKTALSDIKDNLSLGEGKSQLRDSVSLLILNEIADQETKCSENMRATASEAAESKLKEHVTAYHKRDSKAPPAHNAVRIDVANLKPFLKWLVVALLSGGGIFGGYQIGQSTETQAKSAPPAALSEDSNE